MPPESDAKITKKSFISLELFIMAIVTTASLVCVWANLNNGLQRVSSETSVLAAQYRSMQSELQTINKTLSEMLVAAKIQNELAKAKMGDRWTASMQEDLTRTWYDLFKRLHPEIKSSEMPDVRKIQAKYGFNE